MGYRSDSIAISRDMGPLSTHGPHSSVLLGQDKQIRTGGLRSAANGHLQLRFEARRAYCVALSSLTAHGKTSPWLSRAWKQLPCKSVQRAR